MNQAQKTNTIRIVAAVLDTQHLQLYRQDGTSFTIEQGDARIRPILEKATPDIIRQGYCDISLDAVGQTNSYKEFEEQSGGVIRLFRVAREKLKTLFGANDPKPVMEPTSVGTIPTATAANDAATQAAPTPVMAPAPGPVEEAARMKQVVAEIMLHAVPVSSPEFNESGIQKQANIVEINDHTPGKHVPETEPDTIIAVVDDKIIPGMEKIKTQFTAAASLGNTKGVENMLKRLSKVIHERKHSVNDLLKFLERADLPIADDGSIIIYKVLNRTSPGVFVDVHSKKVTQKVGSYVCMDPSLVDHNRKNECSNGLHVARRGYISQFAGQACVLAKLAPEDVIAVPEYDANKMRVCGYHIVAELSAEMYSLLKSNRPITSIPAGAELLARVIAGDHIGKIEEVRITGHMGAGLQIKSLVEDTRLPGTVSEQQKPTAPTTHVAPVMALSNPDEAPKGPAVDPREVVKEVTQVSRKETAKGLYDTFQRAVDPDEKATALKALMDYKKSMKVGWDKLGIPNPAEAPAKAPVATKPVQKPKATNQVKAKTPMSSQSPRDQIQHLLPKFTAAIGSVKTDLAHDILTIKKQAKKSWDVLGVPKSVVDQINLRTK